VPTVPLLLQLKIYNRSKLSSDLIAAAVVSMMLIPQSLAYAMLAGLPLEYGLYASIVPIVIYSLLGSSSTLAVGPVAIASIMTASALSSVTQSGLIGYVDGAITLALLSGSFLLLMGFLRFGFIANFLSHSVVSGFIIASGLLIALSQIKHLLGVQISGHTFFDMCYSLLTMLSQSHTITVFIGVGALVFLLLARKYAAKCMVFYGISLSTANTLSRIAPVVGVVATTLIVALTALDQKGVAIVGDIPSGIGQFGLPSFNLEAIKALILPAVFISIIGYVESISVGRTLGAKRQEKIVENQELIALGGANIASGLMGAFPVTGGFSRSVVNFDAGAQTQFAGIYTAITIAIVSFFLTPLLYFLPIAMLAATIIVAVLSLLDFSVIRQAWNFSRSDFYAVAMTIALTLMLGVEAGVASGIVASIILHLYHTSRPHVAEIGLLPNSEHFRNIDHYKAETIPEITSLRIDESLIFSNVNYLDEHIHSVIKNHKKTQHIILHCGAINTIDLSALEMLEALNTQLLQSNIKLHLSELKKPVKDILDKANFFDHLGGSLFLSQYEAYDTLSKNYKNGA
jgi:SulP family sulfate permease